MTHHWSQADRDLVRAKYAHTWASKVELARRIGTTPYAISAAVKKLGITHKPPIWSEVDLQYLIDNYGLISDEAICRHLGRTRFSLRMIIKHRHLHINKKMAFYTAREAAKQTGIG